MSLIGSFAAKVAARFDDRVPVFYAADAVLFTLRDGVWHVLLIQRGWDPHKGKLAFPGGHVDARETSHEAAQRETAEETGLDLARVELRMVDVYDTPGRDSRGRYVSVAYTGILSDAPDPTAGDDAADAAWLPVRIARRIALSGGFAFDHDRILLDAIGRAGLDVGQVGWP